MNLPAKLGDTKLKSIIINTPSIEDYFVQLANELAYNDDRVVKEEGAYFKFGKYLDPVLTSCLGNSKSCFPLQLCVPHNSIKFYNSEDIRVSKFPYDMDRV